MHSEIPHNVIQSMNEPITWKEPFEYKLNINKMKEPQEITKAYQKFYGEDAKTQFS